MLRYKMAMYPRQNRPLVLVAAVLGVASVAAALVSPPASARTAGPITVALLSVNDFQGEIADPTTVQFAGTIEKQRALHGEDSTLILSAGDMIDGHHGDQNPQSLHFVPALRVLNALGVRASAVGNHEFHNWYGALKTTIPAAADFPLLSANILKGDAPQFPAYKIFDVAGLEVAVIGATTRDTALVDSRVTVCGLTFTDPVDAVNATAAELTARPDPPDVIVAVLHEGVQGAGLTDDKTRVGTAMSADVDVVFGGHTHEKVMFQGPVPGEPGKTRPVMAAEEHGKSVSEVALTIDPKTKDVLSYTMSLVDRVSDSSESLIATYPRVAQVDAIVQDALVNPPGKTDEPVGLC